jgi:hypothetical protein
MLHRGAFRCAGHRYIQKDLPPEARAQCYFINSFFYKKLTEKSNGGSKAAAEGQPTLSAAQRAFERVKKWTKARLRLASVLTVHFARAVPLWASCELRKRSLFCLSRRVALVMEQCTHVGISLLRVDRHADARFSRHNHFAPQLMVLDMNTTLKGRVLPL